MLLECLSRFFYSAVLILIPGAVVGKHPRQIRIRYETRRPSALQRRRPYHPYDANHHGTTAAPQLIISDLLRPDPRSIIIADDSPTHAAHQEGLCGRKPRRKVGRVVIYAWPACNPETSGYKMVSKGGTTRYGRWSRRTPILTEWASVLIWLTLLCRYATRSWREKLL